LARSPRLRDKAIQKSFAVLGLAAIPGVLAALFAT